MKRNAVLEVISRKLTARNSGSYSYNEREHADIVLKALEDLDIIKPTHHKVITRYDAECCPYEDTVLAQGWEKEE